MNEITKIHLGRQAFTIAVDAYKALQDYLHAIKRHMGGSDEVLEEIELRMVELLAERGVSGDKVILAQDVDYLKEQLGKPGDFGAEGDDAEGKDAASGSKRLYRDTEHAMIAGVAAGLGRYINMDPVFVRLLFILATLAGGWGIAAYLIMWLIVPPANTTSEKLQLRGKAVTIGALKKTVAKADVPGAALRAGKTVSSVIERIFQLSVTVLGVLFALGGIMMLFGLTAGSVYLWLNWGSIVPYNLFPVGTEEWLLVGLVLLIATILALLFLAIGVATAKRTWRLPGWVLAVLAGILLTSIALGSALGADTAAKVHDRFEAAHHSEMRSTTPFESVTVMGSDDYSRVVPVRFAQGKDYSVEIRYLGNGDASNVTVRRLGDKTLVVDTRGFKSDPRCRTLCVFRNNDLELVIHTPDLKPVHLDGHGFSSSFGPVFDGLEVRPMPGKPIDN